MSRNPWEMEVHARYRQEEIVAAFRPTRATAARPAPVLLRHARRAAGARLIAIDEWLAGSATTPGGTGRLALPAPRG